MESRATIPSNSAVGAADGEQEVEVRIGSVGVEHAIVKASLEAGSWPQASPKVPFAQHLAPSTHAAAPPPPMSRPTPAGVAPSPPVPEGTFEQRVAAMAGRLRMRAGDLMAVMRFESGLRPDAINPTSHAVGLIQLLPRNAADLLGLPMTPDREARGVQAFASMSADEQLGYVEAYLERVLGGHGAANLRDAYMAVFYPAALRQGDGYVIARADGESAFGRAVYRQNAALDANGDGVITAGEAARRVSCVRG
jgi:hypothetical protein